MIKVFYDDLILSKPKIKLLEAPFKMDLSGYKFYGRMDRIDETTDGWEIIDYKTGKPMAKHSRNDLDQLKVYQWAAEEYWHAKVTGLTYWYLKENKKTPVEPASEEEIVNLKKQLTLDIENIIDAIKHDRFSELHELVKTKHTCSPLIANLL
jgi:RecB family exonuclease